MRINVSGDATRMVKPDQIIATVNFSEHADTYDEALKRGVELVKKYLKFIEDNTDFKAEDFKTNAYYIEERFSINQIEAKTEADLEKHLTKQISEGFYFSQRAFLEFDYDKERLARILVLTSKTEGAPRFHIDFGLKDKKSYERGLIGDAYRDAQQKAETLAAAAGKTLRDCVNVNVDTPHSGFSRDGFYDGDFSLSNERYTDNNIKAQLQTIDETFHPNDIEVSKSIDVVWETSN